MSRLTAALLGVVVTLGVVALVVLTLGHADTTALLGFLAPVVAVLLVLVQGGRMEKVQTEHGAQLSTITHQTNGVLTERIGAAVKEAIDNHPALSSVTPASDPVDDLAAVTPGG